MRDKLVGEILRAECSVFRFTLGAVCNILVISYSYGAHLTAVVRDSYRSQSQWAPVRGLRADLF